MLQLDKLIRHVYQRLIRVDTAIPPELPRSVDTKRDHVR